MLERLSKFALLMTIISSSVNIFPILLISWIFNFFLFLLHALVKRKIYLDISLFTLFVFCIFYLFYAFLIGVDVLEFEIYRRELKFFIPISNCFFLAQLKYPKNIFRSVTICILLLIIINIIFLIFSAFFIGSKISLLNLYPFSPNMWESYSGSSLLYTGMFSTHTALGGWIGMMIVFIFILATSNKSINTKSTLMLCALLIFLFALLFIARSRAYLVSILFVFGIFMFKDYFKSYFAKNLVTIVLLFGVFLGGFNVLNQINNIDIEDIEINYTDSRSNVNVTTRFILWAIALNNFYESPVIGVGATRYDDNPIVLATFPEGFEMISDSSTPQYLETSLFKINNGPFQAHTDQHAHNMLFNVIAETGLIGLSLLSLMIVMIFRNLNYFLQKSMTIDDRVLVRFLYYSFILLVCASFFGNNFLGLIPGYMIFGIYGYAISSFKDH